MTQASLNNQFNGQSDETRKNEVDQTEDVNGSTVNELPESEMYYNPQLDDPIKEDRYPLLERVKKLMEELTPANSENVSTNEERDYIELDNLETGKLEEMERSLTLDVEEKEALRLLSKDEFTLGELVSSKIFKVPFLWEGFIPRYAITFITGPSDSNKSTFLRQLAIAVAGGDWELLSKELRPRHKKAILVSTEDIGINLVAYVKKQIEDRDIKVIKDNVKFICKTKGALARVKKLLTEGDYDLVILDAWTDLFSGNLNQANEVRSSLEELNDIVRAHRCAIVALQHERKGAEEMALSKENMLGSTGIQAKSRSLFQMSRTTGNGRRLTLLKSNYVSESHDSRKTSLLLELDENSMNLKYVGGAGIYGIKKSRRGYSEEDKGKWKPFILKLKGEGKSLEYIIRTLSEEFPDDETPNSKNTIATWIKSWEEEEGQSANPPKSLND